MSKFHSGELAIPNKNNNICYRIYKLSNNNYLLREWWRNGLFIKEGEEFEISEEELESNYYQALSYIDKEL